MDPGQHHQAQAFPASGLLARRAPSVEAFNNWFAAASPWNPIQGRTQGPPRNNSHSHHRPSVHFFSAYQQSIAASECDTAGFRRLPSDSGYESLGRTLVNASIYGDRPGETASVLSGLIEHPVDRPTIADLDHPRPGAAHPAQANLRVGGNVLVCPTCRENVKTKSELKYVLPTGLDLLGLADLLGRKHKQKHEKPHFCDVQGCPRIEGFSTPNDVERHKKSCHPDQVSGAKFFKCTVDGCRHPDKKWPRADNFRQHLKRVHNIQLGDSDLEQYTYK